MGRRLKNLFLNVVVTLVASRHNHNVILLTDCHLIKDTGKITDYGIHCIRKQSAVGKFRAVIINHTFESHVGNHRNQLLRHMAAAEHVYRTGSLKRLAVIFSAAYGGLHRLCLCQRFYIAFHGDSGKSAAFRIDPHGPSRLVRNIGDDPAVLIPLTRLDAFLTDGKKILVVRAYILEIDHYVSSADHS